MLRINDKKGIKKKSLIKRLKKKLLSWFHLTNDPVIKLYHGYGNDKIVTVFGHVLKLGPLPRKKYRKNILHNTYGLFRLFMVKPDVNATVKMQWEGIEYETKTEDDGFFKFELKTAQPIRPGWHPVKVHLFFPDVQRNPVEAFSEFFIPYNYEYAFISDIDDTFLVSHSSNLRKRFYVLLTKNARSRKPFEGVVNHYQLLANTGASRDTHNMFFYVSSSEWNLYDYISEFSFTNNLPKGIYLLNQLKTFSQVFKTGQNNHKTKFMRISRIMEAYPAQKFVLLGDDSQEDPNIYSAVVEHFPHNVHAIYLRHVVKSHQERVNGIVEKIKEKGVRCCYFTHSSEAVIHSRQIGLICET